MTLISKQDRSAIMIQRIRALLMEHGLTDAALAQRIGIPQGTISRLLAGETVDPRISTIAAIADALNTTVSYLIDLNYRSEIPVLKWSQVSAFFHGTFDEAAQTHWIFSNNPTPKGSFAVIAARSMEPRYRANSFLIIERTSDIYDSQAVILLDINNDPVIRKVIVDGSRFLFSELNSNVIDRSISQPGSHVLVGVVTESRFQEYEIGI